MKRNKANIYKFPFPNMKANELNCPRSDLSKNNQINKNIPELELEQIKIIKNMRYINPYEISNDSRNEIDILNLNCSIYNMNNNHIMHEKNEKNENMNKSKDDLPSVDLEPTNFINEFSSNCRSDLWPIKNGNKVTMEEKYKFSNEFEKFNRIDLNLRSHFHYLKRDRKFLKPTTLKNYSSSVNSNIKKMKNKIRKDTSIHLNHSERNSNEILNSNLIHCSKKKLNEKLIELPRINVKDKNEFLQKNICDELLKNNNQLISGKPESLTKGKCHNYFKRQINIGKYSNDLKKLEQNSNEETSKNSCFLTKNDNILLDFKIDNKLLKRNNNLIIQKEQNPKNNLIKGGKKSSNKKINKIKFYSSSKSLSFETLNNDETKINEEIKIIKQEKNISSIQNIGLKESNTKKNRLFTKSKVPLHIQNKNILSSDSSQFQENLNKDKHSILVYFFKKNNS